MIQRTRSRRKRRRRKGKEEGGGGREGEVGKGEEIIQA
jgi:hypothetical protein